MNINEIYWNPDEWQYSDKDWLAQRKIDWASVQKNLKLFHSTEFKGAYLKHHKNLFFKGLVEQENLKECGGDEFQFNLALYILWYHPNLTEAAIKRVIDYHCLNSSVAISFITCRHKIGKLAGQCADKFDPEFGFMGGKEEQMIKIFWGEPLIGTKVDYAYVETFGNSPREPVWCHTISNHFWGTIRLINYNGDQMHRHYGQYLFDYAMAVADKLDESGLSWIRVGASKTLFPEAKKAKSNMQSKHSIAIRELMRQRYANGEFPAVVQSIWDDVKNGNTDFG